MKTYLLLDCHFLSHRAYHTTGHLSNGDGMTGVIFGFLRDLVAFQDLHNTNRVAFCWDSHSSVRKIQLPTYKSSRLENIDPDQEEGYNDFRKQIKALRKDHLPSLGYKNIFHQDGYEADDIIASICQNLKEDQEAIIISSDKDLYQLLSPKVWMWNPNKKLAITHESFSQHYGITPAQWVDVKAMAGCHTDDVPGIAGIGELTAAKFLRGALKPASKAYDKIVRGNAIWKRNISLVKLPYAGTNEFRLVKDKVNVSTWQNLADRLGMKTLRDAMSHGA